MTGIFDLSASQLTEVFIQMTGIANFDDLNWTIVNGGKAFSGYNGENQPAIPTSRLKASMDMETPIRLGLIGCGGIVQRAHVPAFLSLNNAAKIVALADPITANLESVARRLGVVSTQRYTDYRVMLAKADIDAVSIATPHFLHTEQVIAAAEASVAIISEKPMATSLEEANAILEAVERHRVPYTVIHNLLFSPPMKQADAELRDGVMGTPIFGRGQSMWLKSADFFQRHWLGSKAAGGGCALDTSYHEIYSVEALMDTPIRYVSANVNTLGFQTDVDDMAVMLLEHENGTVSTVTASWCSPAINNQDAQWCEVHTTNGSIRVNHYSDQPFLRFARPDGWKEVETQGISKQKGETGTGHTEFFAAVFSALADRSELPITGKMARHILAIIQAARQATVERRAVEVCD